MNHTRTMGQRERSVRPTASVALLSLMFVILAATACSGRRGGTATEQLDAEAMIVGPVPVSVENRSQFIVNVFVVRGSLRQRLGEVPPSSTARLVVPVAYTNDRAGFSLQVRTVGSQSQFNSDQFAPQAGDGLLLTVLGRISNSTVVVQ